VTEVTHDDGLARPIAFDARYGDAVERGLVLGGGGVVFVAWLTAYLAELERSGVAVTNADRVVGTSAGSVIATVVARARLTRFNRLIGLLVKRPALIARLAPASALSHSQERAAELFADARDAEPATIRAIGTSALAAHTPGVNQLPAALLMVLQTWTWPGDHLVVTAADAFSGERLVLSASVKVPLLRAVAASASVPGLFAPQPILDRRAMDGGVSGSGIHADLVAGARRALVLPIAGTLDQARFTIQPDATDREVAALRASGTDVAVRHSRLPLATNLMDPAEVPSALELGATQAREDAPGLRDFWS
jgi:NTE family protein